MLRPEGPAQHSPGQRPGFEVTIENSPEGATQFSRNQGYDAPTGLNELGSIFPRALPWAMLRCPFGAKKVTFHNPKISPDSRLFAFIRGSSLVAARGRAVSTPSICSTQISHENDPHAAFAIYSRYHQSAGSLSPIRRNTLCPVRPFFVLSTGKMYCVPARISTRG